MNLRTIFMIVFFFIASLLTGQSNENRPLILGIHPYAPASEIQKRFTPLAKYLSEKLGRTVDVHVGTAYSEHIKSVATNRIDIAFLGSSGYVLIAEAYDEKPLLGILEQAGSHFYKGHIVTRQDNPHTKISDFDPSEFAFVDPHSTMGFFLPLYMYKEAGIDISALSGINFLKTHGNVALGVLIGDYPVGAVKEEVFFEFEEKGLKSIAITPQIPAHCFVARSDMSPEMIEEIRQALYQLEENDAGLAILQSIKAGLTGIKPVEPAAYDQLAQIIKQIEYKRPGK